MSNESSVTDILTVGARLVKSHSVLCEVNSDRCSPVSDVCSENESRC